MTRNIIKLALLLTLPMLLFVGCNLDKCKDTQVFTKYTPVYISFEDLRKDVSAEAAREMKSPGKMYFYNNYLLINEVREGIHVFDNSDPSNPKPVTFLKIPGNIDMAVRNDILFADSYTDLIAVNISNILQPKTTERRQNAFLGFASDPANGLIKEYLPTREKVTIDCNDPNWGRGWFPGSGGIWWGAEDSAGGVLNNVPVKSTGAGAGTSGSPTNIGTQGSQARFTLFESYLYTVSQGRMVIYDVSSRLTELSTLTTWWNTETIFAYGKALYVGTPNGLIIFDNSNPSLPKQASTVQHIVGCDPVVVDGNKAYVTIRTGTTCAGTENLLEVIDVSNIYAPIRIAQYNMQNPHGLSVESNNLYVCEGKFGLKVFDRSNNLTIDKNRLANFTDFHAYDVIALPLDYPLKDKKIVMLIGDDGFVQYDATDIKNIRKLSTIKVQK
ncbi:MAG: LVIVD repeat-containing protein [Saprospiraceae bacterium]